jgi:hypothetical protein
MSGIRFYAELPRTVLQIYDDLEFEGFFEDAIDWLESLGNVPNRYFNLSLPNRLDE